MILDSVFSKIGMSFYSLRSCFSKASHSLAHVRIAHFLLNLCQAISFSKTNGVIFNYTFKLVLFIHICVTMYIHVCMHISMYMCIYILLLTFYSHFKPVCSPSYLINCCFSMDSFEFFRYIVTSFVNKEGLTSLFSFLLCFFITIYPPYALFPLHPPLSLM